MRCHGHTKILLVKIVDGDLFVRDPEEGSVGIPKKTIFVCDWISLGHLKLGRRPHIMHSCT